MCTLLATYAAIPLHHANNDYLLATHLDQEAERARWEVPGGPWLRAQSASWLWLSPATLPAAAGNATALLREFALSTGKGTHKAAAALLGKLMPEEVRSTLEQVRMPLP